MNTASRKRILVVNCYFDDSHQRTPRPRKVPQPMGPIYLAGAFSPRLCEIRLYNEVASGPLEDEHLLEWPDMLVLTGLTNAFDRMLHLTAYARTKNPRVIVVAGGPPIRALPRLAQRFFDYPCLGDIEQLGEVITEALGAAFVAEEMRPRYDLGYWIGRLGYVETSRYCNFRCSFCALTGEGRRYQSYSPDYIRDQILAMGKKDLVLLIDNNFYGSDRNHFLGRVDVMKEMWQAGHFKGWAALVTNDFFYRNENLKQVREAGCALLFSGVESFDTEWLRGVNKMQNVTFPQVELIRKCLDAGIVFCYGLILDVAARRVADLRRELDFITGTPDITLPGFLTLPIPLLGTPFFRECLARRAILPNTKLRDMDGTTLVLRPLDPFEEVLEFLRDMVSFRGYRGRALRHSAGFARRYRAKLTSVQMVAALGNAAMLCADRAATAPLGWDWLGGRSRKRTHVSTTEPLDDVYQPAFRVAPRYEHYFRPTMVTDHRGNLTDDLADSGLLAQPDEAASLVTAR